MEIYESKIAVEILIYLYKNKDKENLSNNLSFELRRTYSAVSKTLKFLRDNEFIKSKNIGRKKPLKLTNKGIDAALNLIELTTL
jgi:predicted transcriptional regulator